LVYGVQAGFKVSERLKTIATNLPVLYVSVDGNTYYREFFSVCSKEAKKVDSGDLKETKIFKSQHVCLFFLLLRKPTFHELNTTSPFLCSVDFMSFVNEP
jgi:hypothetical protein